MADEEIPQEPTAEAEPKPETTKPGSKMPIVSIAALAGALVLGLGFGGIVLGPKMITTGGAATVAAVNSPTEKAAEKPKKKHESKKSSARGETITFKLESLVVNPAGSEGRHFLMTSVVFEVGSESDRELLQSDEHAIEDLVVTCLGRRNLAWLAGSGARDSLKILLAESVAKRTGIEDVEVYLPQFVIQ